MIESYNMTTQELIKAFVTRLALFGLFSAAIRGFKGINLPLVVGAAVVITGIEYYRKIKGRGDIQA